MKTTAACAPESRRTRSARFAKPSLFAFNVASLSTPVAM